MFQPYKNKFVIKPLSTSVIDTEKLNTVGEVISIGSEVTWVKPGDIVFFASYGAWKTDEYGDYPQFWVVEEASPFILGKIEGKQKDE